MLFNKSMEMKNFEKSSEWLDKCIAFCENQKSKLDKNSNKYKEEFESVKKNSD
jgi:hypothetical protein